VARGIRIDDGCSVLRTKADQMFQGDGFVPVDTSALPRYLTKKPGFQPDEPRYQGEGLNDNLLQGLGNYISRTNTTNTHPPTFNEQEMATLAYVDPYLAPVLEQSERGGIEDDLVETGAGKSTLKKIGTKSAAAGALTCVIASVHDLYDFFTDMRSCMRLAANLLVTLLADFMLNMTQMELPSRVMASLCRQLVDACHFGVIQGAFQ
jgi:hypothetical protein